MFIWMGHSEQLLFMDFGIWVSLCIFMYKLLVLVFDKLEKAV